MAHIVMNVPTKINTIQNKVHDGLLFILVHAQATKDATKYPKYKKKHSLLM